MFVLRSLKEGNGLKKVFIVLVLISTLLFTTVVFAANDKINDPLLPTSPDTVTERKYGEPNEFEDDPVPETAPVIDIIEGEIPEALPQTGGIPAEAFYIAGGICILSAILLLTKNNETSSK